MIAWNDYLSEVREALEKQALAFGLDLGPAGTVVQAYPQRMYEIVEEVLDKEWNEESRSRLLDAQDPVILIVDTNWVDFDPSEHDHGFVWLSAFRESPNEIRRMLHGLANHAKEGDLFQHVAEISAKKDGGGSKRSKRRYEEVGNGMLGVSVRLQDF